MKSNISQNKIKALFMGTGVYGSLVFKELDTNFTTQKNFLTNLGIKQRAEIICKSKTFKERKIH